MAAIEDETADKFSSKPELQTIIALHSRLRCFRSAQITQTALLKGLTGAKLGDWFTRLPASPTRFPPSPLDNPADNACTCAQKVS